jgi:hypothetical protein
VALALDTLAPALVLVVPVECNMAELRQSHPLSRAKAYSNLHRIPPVRSRGGEVGISVFWDATSQNAG